VHFIDAWTRLTPGDFARLLIAPMCVILSIAVPGRRVSASACVGLALAALLLPDAAGAPYLATLALRLAWALLWLLLGATLVRVPAEPPPDSTTRRGGFESGTLGLLLGLALFTLLVAALARADLDDRLSRESSYAVLLLALGLMHLMLRRHVLRAALAFGVLGFALDRLVRAAEAQQVPARAAAPLAVWLATALAISLVVRIAGLRQEGGGGAWVNHAHDLHD